MNNVVTRSLVLLAVSTAIVLVSAFVAPPPSPTHTAANTEQGGMEGHAMDDMGMTVDSEEAFIAGMIPHHQEAVESARAVLETTQRPEVRELAQDVIDTQTEEIATLEGWLAQWYPDAAEADYASMMTDPAGLNPDEADRAFLEGMIMHHQGAIDMARSYLDADFEKQAEVVEMAEAIVTVQDGEIEQMQGWLDEWYGDTNAGHNSH
jgi:uncharacterized protein (DUF305 family)